jgi:hypothetical protein
MTAHASTASPEPQPERAEVAPTTGRMLTRGEVASALGASKTTIRRFEQREVLHPTIGPKGVRLFAEEEVQLVSRRQRVGIAPP